MAKAGDGRARDGRKGDRKEAPAQPQAPLHPVRTVVDRKPGVVVVKVAGLDKAAKRLVGVAYQVEFDGCEPLPFNFLKEARDRAAQPAPERATAAAA